MATLIRYRTTNLTRERYDKISEFFQQQMQQNADLTGPPQALQVHVLFDDGGNSQVSEIWESEDSWREMYDGLLGQALDYAGIERDPQVLPIEEFWGSGGVPSPPPPPGS
jgi:hypothetical protein